LRLPFFLSFHSDPERSRRGGTCCLPFFASPAKKVRLSADFLV
jgi:hypothetical protein